MQAVRRVDLRDADGDAATRRRFFETLCDGLHETGFVRVVGHGVDPSLVARTHALFARFFELDEAAKLRAGGVAGGQRGFTPFGVEHARDSLRPDQKEFFHVGQEHPPPRAPADPYPANVWPVEVPGLRESALELYRALERAAGILLRAIALGHALPSDVFASMIEGGNSILRAVHYLPVAAGALPVAAGALPVAAGALPVAAGAPPVAAGAPLIDCAEDVFVVRAAAHEDINLVTLLCGATDEGLELRTRSGAWTGVACEPDEIVADVGDMLARMTNDRLPATTHRVVARGEAARRHRYALPFFAHPRPDCDLGVLPAFLERDESPRFAPITAQAFLEERLREIGLAPGPCAGRPQDRDRDRRRAHEGGDSR